VKNHFTILFFFILFFSFSCTKKEIPALTTFSVVKADFENIISIPGYVDPLNSISVSCPGQLNGTILSIVKDGSTVTKGDTVCVLENADILAEIQQIETNIQNAEMQFEKLKANHALKRALLEAEVKTNAAETLIANLDSLQLKFNSPNQRKIKELELKIANIKKSKIDKRLKASTRIQQSELRSQEFQIKRLVTRLESTKERLKGLKLVAPASGIALLSVNFLSGKKMNVGDPVWDNMSVMSIPTNDKFKIKIEASEDKFKQIVVGKHVEFSFDAMPENIGWGKITQKSPVGRPIKKDSKVKIFEIEASLDSFKIMPEPGFTCECNIQLLQLKDTIVVPQVAVFEQDSMRVVYVKNNLGYEMRQVKTGLSSANEIVISKGLKLNEKITLTKPDDEFINKKTVFKTIKIAKSVGAKGKFNKIIL